MAVRTIVTVDAGDPVLREKAEPVRRMTPQLRSTLDDMVDTMRDAPGVGLAGPQIGLRKRLIVVEVPDPDAEGDDPEHVPTRLHRLADPVIVWMSDETKEGQEACLSIPGLYGDVTRARAITVKAMDASGRQVEISAEGYEARVFQHEIDHLDGVLFTDRVTSLEKLYHLEEQPDGEVVRVPYELQPA